MNESHPISQIYSRDLPEKQVWLQAKDREFVAPSANCGLNQPGPEATEMSRRKIRRDREQRQKEKEVEQKRRLEDKKKLKRKGSKDRRIYKCKEQIFGQSFQHLLQVIIRNRELSYMFLQRKNARYHLNGLM